MADEADKHTDDDELLLTEEAEDETPPEGEVEETDEPEGDDEEEEVLTFGDDLTEEKPDDSSTIKHLREEVKKLRKEVREREAAPAAPQQIEVGEKPTLESCDFDEEKFETALDAWKERKAASERQQTEATEAQRKQAEEWQGELRRYNEEKTKLGYADVDEAEETVTAALSEVQQAVLVKVADNPAKVLYALAKHPDRLADVAKINDPLKFAGALARLEGQLKVVKKRKAPEPEAIERASGSMNAGKRDKQLERLEKEADQTGDRTKLVAYKKKLRAEGKL